jgi:FkbM family methyltransferase
MVIDMQRETRGVSSRLRFGHDVMLFASRIKWAEPELRGLGALVKQGDRVIDVGAAHGMYTIPLAHIVGSAGRVDSFDPHPRQQSTLRRWRRILGAPHVSVNPSAVGREEGQLTMRLPLFFGLPIYGRAHLTEGAAPLGAREMVRHWLTPIAALDDWVEAERIGPVSFIKVDVEGFEPQVIEGAAKMISRDLPSLLLEIEDRHLARYGRDADGFVASIHERWPEYGLYTWRGGTWTRVPAVELGTRNYLFATDEALARA